MELVGKKGLILEIAFFQAFTKTMSPGFQFGIFLQILDTHHFLHVDEFWLQSTRPIRGGRE